jgi:hypothetical protein
MAPQQIMVVVAELNRHLSSVAVRSAFVVPG